MSHDGTDPIRTPNRTPNRISETESHERTNARTDVEDQTLRKSSSLQGRARGYGDVGGLTLAELMDGDGKPRRDATHDSVRRLAAALENRNQSGAPDYRFAGDIARDWQEDWEFDGQQHRWPVLRTGEREPISWLLRLSVYRRHQYTCAGCGWALNKDDDIELDHCLPWSAGGTDDSDNLRLLCRGCNQRRSNNIDLAHVRIHRPTTWWCFDCWSGDSHDDRHELIWRNGIGLSQVPYVDDDRVTSTPEQTYCAFCDHFTLSSHYFVGQRGRDLAAACEPQEWIHE